MPQGDIAQAARWYARPAFAGSCLIWGMGITQHINGTSNAHAVLNLSLVAGQMGFAGSGISPLRGQNNVQGAATRAACRPTCPATRAMGPRTSTASSGRWGARPPAEPGLVVTEMIEGCLDGRVRAMYVVGENPLLSEPDLHHAEKAIEQLDFLVVQDLFMHETAERAHVFLPAAAFAEKDGTFTNSERRVQRIRQAIDPPGQARPDWWIACELAKRTARRLGISVSGFDYHHPSEIFDEMARLWPSLARHVLRAARERWPPVAVPDPRPSGHAVPLRRVVPARQGALRAGHAERRGGRAAGPRLPLRAQHRPAALPLARRHA